MIFFIVEEGYLYSNDNYKSSGCFSYNVYIKSHIHLIESVMMRKNQIVGKTLWWKIVICANRNQENTSDRKCTCRLYGQMGDNDTWPWSAYIIFFNTSHWDWLPYEWLLFIYSWFHLMMWMFSFEIFVGCFHFVC